MGVPVPPHAPRPLESLGSTSASLVQGIRARKPEAWQRLVELFTPPIYGLCRSRGLQESDAADVVQQTFCEVVQGIDAFQWEDPSCTLRGWVWTIARRRIFDHLRRQAKRPLPPGGSSARERLEQLPDDSTGSVNEPSPPADQQAELDFKQALTRRAAELVRAEFEEKTWLAFRGTAIEGRSAADVGHDLGMTKEAVRTAKSRVLRRLRRELDGIL